MRQLTYIGELKLSSHSSSTYWPTNKNTKFNVLFLGWVGVSKEKKNIKVSQLKFNVIQWSLKENSKLVNQNSM